VVIIRAFLIFTIILYQNLACCTEEWNNWCVMKKQLLVHSILLVLFSGVYALASCDASAAVGTGSFCVPNSACTGGTCCALSGEFSNTLGPGITVTKVTGGICASATVHDISNDMASTPDTSLWQSRVGRYENTDLLGIRDINLHMAVSCSDSSDSSNINLCEKGERALLLNMDSIAGDDVVRCITGSDGQCCSPTVVGDDAGGRCNIGGNTNLDKQSAPCCDIDATCLQADKNTYGSCRRCAMPGVNTLPDQLGAQNEVGDDCSGGRECCFFADGTPLRCVNGTCQRNLELQYCDAGGVSKIKVGTACALADGSVDKCSDCPGGATYTEIKSTPEYGNVKVCKGLPEGDGICGDSCHCESSSLSCDSSQKCAAAGSCAKSGADCTSLSCCNGLECDSKSKKCVSNSPAAGTCPDVCDSDNSVCSSDCPCVGGQCRSTAGANGSGAIPCSTDGCGGDCPNARSCVGGFCSDNADCTPAAIDISKYAYKGPQLDSITGLLSSIFRVLYFAGLGIGLFAIVKNGYELMTSQGDPNAVRSAQENLTAAILGIIFILLSITILRVIITSLLGNTVSF
jgi:hypothetical protein